MLEYEGRHLDVSVMSYWGTHQGEWWREGQEEESGRELIETFKILSWHNCSLIPLISLNWYNNNISAAHYYPSYHHLYSNIVQHNILDFKTLPLGPVEQMCHCQSWGTCKPKEIYFEYKVMFYQCAYVQRWSKQVVL